MSTGHVVRVVTGFSLGVEVETGRTGEVVRNDSQVRGTRVEAPEVLATVLRMREEALILTVVGDRRLRRGTGADERRSRAADQQRQQET